MTTTALADCINFISKKLEKVAEHQFTSLLSILDHIERSTILDGSTGVHELGLGIDVATSLLAETVETDLFIMSLRQSKEVGQVQTGQREGALQKDKKDSVYQRGVSKSANKAIDRLLRRRGVKEVGVEHQQTGRMSVLIEPLFLHEPAHCTASMRSTVPLLQ